MWWGEYINIHMCGGDGESGRLYLGGRGAERRKEGEVFVYINSS